MQGEVKKISHPPIEYSGVQEDDSFRDNAQKDVNNKKVKPKTKS